MLLSVGMVHILPTLITENSLAESRSQRDMMATCMYPPQIKTSLESLRYPLPDGASTPGASPSAARAQHRGASRPRVCSSRLACLIAGVLAVLVGGVAGDARAQKKVTVFEPKVEGGTLSPEERKAIDAALSEALREQGGYQVVPAYERDAILQGEKVTACESADCQVRIGRVLESTYMMHYSISLTRGEDPAGKKKKGREAEPAPTGAGGTTWRFSASLFNVPYMSMAESAQSKEAVCAQCSTQMAAQKLGELVKQIVLADTSHARGMVEVTTDPAEGVEVVLDGVSVGFTGGSAMQVKTFAGQHQLILRKPGFRSRRELVNVPEGKGTPLPPFKLLEGKDQVVIVVNEAKRGPRPKWRVALGAVLLVGGLATMGFGGRMLYLDGRCTEAPVSPSMQCKSVFDTTTIGAALTIGGGMLALGGLTMVTFPGPKLSPDSQPTDGVQPIPSSPVPASPKTSAIGKFRPRASIKMALGGLGSGYGLAFDGTF